MSLAPLIPDPALAENAALAKRAEVDRERAERVRLAAVEHAKTVKATPVHAYEPEALHFSRRYVWPQISAAEMADWKAQQDARKTPGEREQEEYQRQQTAEWHRRFIASCDREDAMKAERAARQAETIAIHEALGCKPADPQSNYIPGFEEDWTIS